MSKNYNFLDLNKINSKRCNIILTEESLKDVNPIDWSKELIDMRVENKRVTFDLSFTDKEIKVLIGCIKGCEFSESDCRDYSLALDLLREFSELFKDNDSNRKELTKEEILDSAKELLYDDDEYIIRCFEEQIINDVMRKPCDKAIEKNKCASDLVRKLRGN